MKTIDQVAKEIRLQVEHLQEAAQLMGGTMTSRERHIRTLCHDAVIMGGVDELDFDRLYRLSVKA